MGFFELLGSKTIGLFHQLGAVILLLNSSCKELNHLRFRETIKQCLDLGVLSFPIVALTLLFTGMVLSVQIAGELTKYGAGFGTMRVTEQIDALRCMAVSPVGYLVLPRLLSCMAMLPILTVFGVSIGVFGGMIVASLTHGVSSYVFIHSIEVFCIPSDLYIGVMKSVVFGMIVALVGCDRGMTCEAGAEGVGRATTQSVVYSIIMIFAANYLLSSILF